MELQIILLAFREYDTEIYWQFNCNKLELTLFKDEVDQYNIWINKFLKTGKAPLSSYVNPDYADMLLIARNRNYQELFGCPGNRGPYQIGESTDNFRIIDDDDFLAENLTIEPNTNELKNIITSPYTDSGEFGMGYRILPVTNKLIKRRNNNIL